MLTKENWDEARKLIENMPAGPERARLQRLLGQLLWNHSLQLRRDGKEDEATKILQDAAKDLRYNLADCCELNGDRQRARALFEEIMSVDIGYRDVSERVDRLMQGGADAPA